MNRGSEQLAHSLLDSRRYRKHRGHYFLSLEPWRDLTLLYLFGTSNLHRVRGAGFLRLKLL